MLQSWLLSFMPCNLSYSLTFKFWYENNYVYNLCCKKRFSVKNKEKLQLFNDLFI